jgi:RNA polymerase sigma-70 factor (ECF subfamily)
MSHEQAAAALRCPLGTLKSHIARGKQKLKAHLQAWELAS